MTRDQALIIAKRLMRRIEDDQAIHLDSLADELVMGMAVQPIEPDAARLRAEGLVTITDLVERLMAQGVRFTEI